MAEAFGANGGGRPGLYQGKTELLGNALAARAVLAEEATESTSSTGLQPSE